MADGQLQHKKGADVHCKIGVQKWNYHYLFGSDLERPQIKS